MQKFKKPLRNNKLIRCFIAIALPQEIKIGLEQYIRSLRKISPDIRWVRAENIHITLKFLGEIEQDLLDKVEFSLKSISEVFQPFYIYLKGSGSFPNEKRPRIIWVGIEALQNNLLLKIYNWIENRLETLGIKKEQRKYTPHLTIGRIKFPQNMNKLFQYMKQYPFQGEQFGVKEILLMQSLLKPSGVEYKVIDKYS